MKPNNNPSKRSRADTAGNATITNPDAPKEAARAKIQAHSEADIDRWLKTLDPTKQQSLLRQAAILHSDIAESLKSQHDEVVAAEAAKEQSFDNLVRQAEYQLHERFKHLSDSKQYERSYDVESGIEALLQEIAETVEENHSWATKFNALEAMRLIFDETLDAYGVIGDEVRKGAWNWGSYLLKVCRVFSDEDRKKLQEVKTGEDGTLWLDALEGTGFGSEEYNCGRGMEVKKTLRILNGDVVSDDED